MTGSAEPPRFFSQAAYLVICEGKRGETGEHVPMRKEEQCGRGSVVWLPILS